MYTTIEYTNTEAEEALVDFVKVRVLQALVKDGIIKNDVAEKWAENHTIIKKKKSIFRTLSDKWKKEEEKDNAAYWLVVKNIG